MSETATHVASGKVREIYALDDERLLLVASDRISTFDVVLPTEIPDKGRVLTGLSGLLVRADARDRPEPPARGARGRRARRSAERLEMLPIECVVRGYLSGSGWKDYVATGEVCGHRLPEGLVESQQLPQPIFTPSTKATTGHDENIDRAAAVELVGEERFDEVEQVALALYAFVSDYARDRGIILADTKLEFGLDQDGPARARRRGLHARLVALLAGGRVPAGRDAAVVRQAVRARLLRVARLGQDAARARSCPTTSSPARARATSRRSSS